MGERVRGHTKHLGKEERKGVMPPTGETSSAEKVFVEFVGVRASWP